MIEKNFEVENGSTQTAVGSLNRIYKTVNADGLNEGTAGELAEDIRTVAQRFSVSPKAAVLLAAVMETSSSSDCCNLEMLATYIGCSNLEFFSYRPALRELECKGIIRLLSNRRGGYIATPEAVRAVETDTEFIPQKTTGLTTDELFSRIRRLMKDFRNDSIDTERLLDELRTLMETNNQLLFCRKVTDSPLWSDRCSDTERRQFFYLCHRYVTHRDPSVPIDILLNFVEFYEDEERIRRNIANGRTGLQTSGLVSYGIDNGFVDTDKLALSDEVKAMFFSEIELSPEETVKCKELISWESIKEQQLFYNGKEEEAVRRLEDLLEEENFKAVRERLEAEGMPKGFSCIFHGCAGSGKTATLKAIARKTHRDLFWVDLSSIKSKWVGESEKNVKAMFDTYRKLAQTSERAPILAVNEADAIFTRRITNVERSVDQMNNAITDIVLNELENLDGILIATTNLMGNMMGGKDNAMERRFLYKVEFNAPEADVREKIWKAKLPHLEESEARALAEEFTISGGNIDNVARKSVVDFVLNGSHADLDTLRKYCGAEIVSAKKERSKIGFAAA